MPGGQNKAEPATRRPWVPVEVQELFLRGRYRSRALGSYVPGAGGEGLSLVCLLRRRCTKLGRAVRGLGSHHCLENWKSKT